MTEKSSLDSLREALQGSPDNIPLLKMFAQACLDHWSLPEARQAYERILQLRPDDPQAKIGIAWILFKMGKTSEASVRVESIVQAHPDFAPGWLLASKLAFSEGNLEQAKQSYGKAKELDPTVYDEALQIKFAPETNREHQTVELLNAANGWTANENSSRGSDDSLEDLMEQPQLTFKDVGGMETIKEEIRMKIIYPQKNPHLFKAYGKGMGGGVLLYGPPGCGKTLLSRATAGEIEANFLSIGLHQILDMYIGNSEKNLHQLFELARMNKPSILFIDEIDALAANRTDLKQSAARTLINQFLAELDGGVHSNEGVLILGATNAPWHMDPAFRRPGRFDRIIFVPTPDEKARIEIIELLAKDKPVAQLDARMLANKTEGFSGADLRAVFETCAEAVLSRALKENRIIPISTEDLLRSARSMVPSSRAWFESAKNYALFANQSGLYDPILAYLGIKK